MRTGRHCQWHRLSTQQGRRQLGRLDRAGGAHAQLNGSLAVSIASPAEPSHAAVTPSAHSSPCAAFCRLVPGARCDQCGRFAFAKRDFVRARSYRACAPAESKERASRARAGDGASARSVAQVKRKRGPSTLCRRMVALGVRKNRGSRMEMRQGRVGKASARLEKVDARSRAETSVGGSDGHGEPGECRERPNVGAAKR